MSAFLTVPEVASFLGCEPETVRTAIRRGDLRATKVLKKWRVEKADLDRFVAAGYNVGRSAS